MDLSLQQSSSTETRIEKFKDEFVWMIGNVNSYRLKSEGQGIVSPTVFVGSRNDLLGKLRLFSNGITSDFLSLSVYLKTTDEGSSPKFWVYIKCQLMQDDEVLASSTAVGTFCWDQNFHVLQNFVRFSDLEKRERLVIYCFFNILGNSMIRQDGRTSSAALVSVEKDVKDTRGENDFNKKKVAAPIRIHCKHLKVLSLESTDVTLVSHGEEFPAHRNILAADSPVFSAMFIRRAEENAGNRITIDNVYPGVLREILRFVYTRQLKNLELVPNILEAACQYQLHKLKILCERLLFNITNPNNVCGILLIADVFKIQSLKNWALLVIRAYADVVVQTPGFQVLKNSKRSDLMAEVISELSLLAQR